MQNENKRERKIIPRDYLNNSNPYAFLDSYDPGNVLDSNKLARLEATRRIQPEMTPVADIDCLIRENGILINKVINRKKNEIIEEIKRIFKDANIDFNSVYLEKGAEKDVLLTINESSDIYEPKYVDEIILDIIKENLSVNDRMKTIYNEYQCVFLYKKQKSLHEKVFKGFNDVLSSKKYVPKEMSLPVSKEITNLSEAFLFKTIVDRYRKELKDSQSERRVYINNHIFQCYSSFKDDDAKRDSIRKLHYEHADKLKEAFIKYE